MPRCTHEAPATSDRHLAPPARRAFTAPAGLVSSMARGASGSALGTEFDGFLFASVREDGNGPLSVLSTLARLDVDPWQTAATLAALPQGDAAQSLAKLFSGLPGGLENRDAVATRLVACLPNRAFSPAVGQNASAPTGTGAHAQADRLWLIYLLSMLMMLAVQGLVQSQGPPGGPATTAAAISAQAPRPEPGLKP